MECSVCYETKKNITECPFCNYCSCKICIERYSMETTDDLHCMNCKHPFDRSTQKIMFTKTFIDKKYKERREELLFQRETALLPSTQAAIMVEKRRRLYQIEINKCRDIITEKLREVGILNAKINNLTNSMYRNDGQDVEDMKTAASFVLKCSHSDCKGFVSRAYKCGTCSEYTCSECHEPKNGRNDPNHVCDDDKKKSIELIQRECKPCISCGTQIHKISGCPQMFCTQCNILFDWNTGKRISHSSGHNPHFVQWLRDNGRSSRDVGDVLCGGFPQIEIIVHRISTNSGYFSDKQKTKDILDYITCAIRTLFHIHHYERPRYPINWADNLDFENLRIKWSLGDFDDNTYKTLIQRMEKKNNLKKEIGFVLEMITNSSIDILQRFVANEIQNDGLHSILDNLRTYSNECFKNISNSYSNKTPFIDEKWNFVSKH